MKTPKKKPHTKLRGLMAERKISMTELSDLIKISRMSLYNKLEGRRAFKADEIKNIIFVMNLTDKEVKEVF